MQKGKDFNYCAIQVHRSPFGQVIYTLDTEDITLYFSTYYALLEYLRLHFKELD